ncbi:hypothetical protein Adt_39719 [Abeliophyllum distichum]|uniref:Uncharacterized protein n=1 Tax=Abeliophyllum distichum TaxID=126358 RepID=A0ABD1Q5W0_9LAMI
MVNLGIILNEMDRVEGCVNYVRDLSGRHEDPEPNPEYWACNKYLFKLNISDFTKLREQYWVPEIMRLILSYKKSRPCSPADGHVAIMSDALACGMRLSHLPFSSAILRS